MRKIVYMIITLVLVGMYSKIEAKDLKNFYKVSNEIYRSAQPDKEEMRMAEKMGVKTVLSLRNYNDDKDEAKGTGLILKRVKMNAGDINDKEIIIAMRIIKESEKPILVHCLHGSDRTGAVIAMYRIIFEGVSKEKAIEEMKEKKYGHHGKIFGNIEEYIIKSDINKLKEEIEK